MNKNLHKLRIISGKFKNKKILIPPLSTTRASKSFLKESFFNIFQSSISDIIFIELFAGSGSMGIEAISRGAKQAIFFEKDKSAFNILKQNIKSLGIENYEAYNQDTFTFSIDIINKINQESILYVDPPFNIRDDMQNIYEKSIDLISQISNTKVKFLVIEHSSDVNFDKEISNFQLYRVRKYGKSTLSFFRGTL